MSTTMPPPFAGDTTLNALAEQFSPALQRIEASPPSPLPRAVLGVLLALCVTGLGWAWFGRLDIVAVADGRLVPRTRVQVVQPADGGVVKEILVREGESVRAGQVLVRMDQRVSDADRLRIEADLAARKLQARRIEAEWAGRPLLRQPEDTAELFAQASAQQRARETALADAISTERAALARAEQDLAAALAVERRLRETLATFRVEEQAWRELQRDGFAGRLQAEDKRRKRAETEQDLESQTHVIAGLRAAIDQARRRLAQKDSQRREQLTAERLETAAEIRRLEGELAKQAVRSGLLELRAPADGVVKELATHTEGAVLGPGTTLMTIIPAGEALQAEVWIGNQDAGFVHEGQPVRVKVVPFPFQKYGMADGRIVWVSADATDAPGGDRPAARYRAIVELPEQALEADGVRHRLTAGMLVSAEVHLGERRVYEYVVSPVTKAFSEAGRER